MAFSFKELLKGYKKPKKGSAKNGDKSSSSGGADGGAATEATPAELGAFPASVHKLWARRRRGWEPTPPLTPPWPPPPTSDGGGGKLAICLTVVDALPHEELWQRWLKGANSDLLKRSGCLHVHAKFPDKLAASQPWASSRCLEHSFVPEWNDIKVARAMVALLTAALEDPAVQFIYLGTESCVPCRSFPETVDVLWAKGPKSWLDMWEEDPPEGSGMKRASKFEASSQFRVVDSQVVPLGAVWKALPGWVVLARHHAEAIVRLDAKVSGELWPAFEQVFAPEEIYFPTCLALAGYAPTATSSQREQQGQIEQSQPQSTTDGSNGVASTEVSTATAKVHGQVVLQALVFAQYPTTGDNRANPNPLDDAFNARFLEQRRREGYLFLRKFKRPLPEPSQALLVDPPAAAAGALVSSGARAEDHSRGHEGEHSGAEVHRKRPRSSSPI